VACDTRFGDRDHIKCGKTTDCVYDWTLV
jgi:hypothetical protein